jgi:hypothetical protein
MVPVTVGAARRSGASWYPTGDPDPADPYPARAMSSTPAYALPADNRDVKARHSAIRFMVCSLLG